MDTNNKYGTLQLQEYLLPMLNDFDTFCKEKGINYSLSDGTLLGAVRHKGFIPWDDDIDISFDRVNYEKFLKEFDSHPITNYEIVQDLWVKRMTRIDNKSKYNDVGCLDLFVFDNVPDNKTFDIVKCFLLKLLQGMLKERLSFDGFSIIQKAELAFTYFIGKLIPKVIKQRLYDYISKWGNSKPTQYIARYNCSYRYISDIRYKPSIVEEYTYLMFEGNKYMSFLNWDDFLKTDYGDYMILPPEEKRIGDHLHGKD